MGNSQIHKESNKEMKGRLCGEFATPQRKYKRNERNGLSWGIKNKATYKQYLKITRQHRNKSIFQFQRKHDDNPIRLRSDEKFTNRGPSKFSKKQAYWIIISNRRDRLKPENNPIEKTCLPPGWQLETKCRYQS